MTVYTLIENHTPAAGSEYSFNVVRALGLGTYDEMRERMVAKVRDLQDDGAALLLDTDGRAALHAPGPAVGCADDCPTRVLFTVTEIDV